MSNTDVVKSAYEALASHDVEKTLACMAADVKYVMPNLGGNLPHGGQPRGIADVSALFQAVAELVTPSEFKPECFLEKDSLVLVVGSEKIHVNANGAEFVNHWVHEFHIADGKIASVRENFDSLAFSQHLGA